ncbi:MAG TPA: hypothetical protein VII20_13070, partial [Roseiarcus sp.]
MTIESAGYARQTPRRLPTYGRYVHAKPRQRFAPPLIRRFAPPSPRKRLFDAHIFSLSFLTNSDSLQGQILEPMMDLSAVDVERYGVGGFGDE